MYAEEADLCYRAIQFGARPLFTPEATIIHYDGGSETILSTRVGRLFSGKITFMTKHWPPLQRILRFLKTSAILRASTYSLISLLTRSRDREAAAREWRTVWSARHQWSKGYGEAGHG